MRWFKLDIDMLRDPKMESLVERYGAEGVGVWVAALAHMYASISDGVPFVEADALTRRVASDVNLGKKRVKNILNFIAELGLFDPEFWAVGKAANERVAEAYESYERKVRAAVVARERAARGQSGEAGNQACDQGPNQA